MQSLYSKKMTEEIYAVLLSNPSSIQHLETKLQKDLSLSQEDVQSMLYQLILKINSSLFPPVSKMELILTEGCNLACSYCFEKNMLGYKKMPLDIARAAVDLLFNYSGNEKSLDITHFGGEPTLNFPAIRFVTEYAEEKASLLGKSIDFNTTSNGVLLNDDMADYFAHHKIKVLLSIDGLKSTHDKFRKDKFGRGTFDQVKKGLKILKKYQAWIGTKMTVMPTNVPNLFNDVTGLYDLGVNQFIIGHATGIKWSNEDIEAFAEQYGKLYQWYKEKPRKDLMIEEFDEIKAEGGYFGCQAGRNSISVAVNGEISPCAKILALNNKELLSKLGDVKYGLSYFRNRLEIINVPRLRSACKAQGIAEEYQGGCFVSNYDDNHDLFQPSIQEHNIAMVKRSACLSCTGCKH